MTTEKVHLKSISLDTLNADCLVAINRCIRYLRQNHDYHLRMREEDLLMKISRAHRRHTEEEFDILYKDLKLKLAECISEQRNESSQRG